MQTYSTLTTSKRLALEEHLRLTIHRAVHKTPLRAWLTMSNSTTSSTIQNRLTRKLSFCNTSRAILTAIRSSSHLNLISQKKMRHCDLSQTSHWATSKSGNEQRRPFSWEIPTKWFKFSSRISLSWFCALEAVSSPSLMLNKRWKQFPLTAPIKTLKSLISLFSRDYNTQKKC